MFTYSAAAVAYTGTTTKTALLIETPAGRRARLLAYGVSFDGATSTATPAMVKLWRCSDNGTGTQVTGSNVPKLDTDGADADTIVNHTITVEPTTTTNIESNYVAQYMGLLVRYCDPVVLVPESGFIAVIITPSATVNASVWMQWEEVN